MNFPAKKKSIMNQLSVQIQELQDKKNSGNDFGDFDDPETARSSGLCHFPSHPVIVPSIRGMVSRDSCLQPDTRNSCDMRGNFFENPSVSNEPTASCPGNVYARSLAATKHRNTGTPIAKMDELERNTQHVAILTPRFARKFSTRNPCSHVEGAYPQNCMVEQPRNQVSEMHFDKFPNH